MDDWNNREKFIWETLRTSIFAITAFFVANFFVSDLKEARAREEVKFQAAIDSQNYAQAQVVSNQQEIINSFLKTSYAYTSELYDHRSSEGSDNIEDLYDAYRSDTNRIRGYFSKLSLELQPKLDELEELGRALRPSSNAPDWKEKRERLKALHIEVAVYLLRNLGLSPESEIN